MDLIDSEQRARRLARTVAADIVLYNEKRLKAGADLAPEIAEGRSHFCARVNPSLHWVFEEVLNTTALRKPAQAEEARVEPAPAEPAPDELSLPEPEPAELAPPDAVLTEPAPPEPPPVEPALVDPAPIEAVSADVRASTPASERPRTTASQPPPYQEPEQLASEELPSSSSPPPAQPEPSMVTSSRSNARSTLVLVFCLLGIALAIGWLLTR